MLCSSAFADWLDHALLAIIKRPDENSPPYMTVTGIKDRVPLDYVLAAATFAGRTYYRAVGLLQAIARAAQ